MSKTPDPRPSDQQIADAIDILSICAPIRDIQGGMWFSHNHNFADATFVDYGACRSFGVAARALPYLKDEGEQTARNRDMWKGQCERQAEQLTKMRSALGRMLSEFEHCEHEGCGCLSCKAIAAARDAISIVSNQQKSDEV